jgi:hypothetical protein
MANLLREHRIIDNNKRALIKYVFISDGTLSANATLVDVSTLRSALNANGYIMVANTHPKSTYRTTIRRIFASGKGNGALKLQWHGDSNSEIIVATTGTFDLDFESMGSGAVITNPEANSVGDILLSTVNIAAGDIYTVLVDLRKDSSDYDAGQTADPAAFNSGGYRLV